MRYQLFKVLTPILAIAVTFAIDSLLPNSTEHPATGFPYFASVLIFLSVVTTLLFLASLFIPRFRETYQAKSSFYTGVILFLCLLNLLTAKTATLPVLYFPTLDRIFGALAEDSIFIGKCLLYSLRLQLIGWFCGALAGIGTGIAIGFNHRIRYWVHPLVRVLGPIPSTAWIPLVLVIFPGAMSASAFLIALAVWFPTTVLTMNGIANIPNAYFEAAATMGATPRYTVFHVGIPAAMPHMFIGLFNGTCASFIILVTAEMLGARFGLGWYINWQKDMMAYANVYAGLIVMSLVCYSMITLLFQLRDKILVWQKGVIKW